MNAITVKDLSPRASRALEIRAAENGRTPEAEITHILEDVLVQHVPAEAGKSATGLVAALQELGRTFPELADLDFPRDRTPARGPTFE